MSLEKENLILQEYLKNPVNNFEIDDYTVKYHEWNFICWDDISVFLRINKNKVEFCSYTWNLSKVSLAVWWFVSELVVEKKIEDILLWDYDYLNKQWIVVSNKRKRAAVLPILAIRNAIHQYLNDWKNDDFDYLIE